MFSWIIQPKSRSDKEKTLRKKDAFWLKSAAVFTGLFLLFGFAFPRMYLSTFPKFSFWEILS